jgi:hypothetical protein
VRIKSALWEFIWFIDKITEEDENGVGWVLGGVPIKVRRIAMDLDEDEKTVRDNLTRLAKGKYVIRRRTPYGFVVGVSNSRKFGIWQSRETGEKARSDRKKGPTPPEQTPELTGEKARNKEDATVDATVDTAAALFWKRVGVIPVSLPGAFRKTCEELLRTKNGQPLGEFMGVCMDTWKALGGKTYPPAFARAKARIAAKEKEQVGRLPELEAIPWQKK